MTVLYRVFLINVLMAGTRVFVNTSEDTGTVHHFKSLPCPNADDIAPCTCTHHEGEGWMDMDCSIIADEQELHDVFHSTIPFPKFRKLTLGTQHLETLTDTVFGDASFELVYTLTDGTLKSIGSKTFINSASTLRLIFPHHNQLKEFPFDTLNQYTALTNLSLYDNPISIFPYIQSETLRMLDLSGGAYHTIPADALDGLPNLDDFRLKYMDVDSFSMEPGLFLAQTKLTQILVKDAGLTHLEALQFAVRSDNIENIDLQANQIETVEADVFRGVQSGTINLSGNMLTVLPEDSWKPLIDAGVHLQLQGNDLTCGCDVAWLVLEPNYHVLVEDAMCHSGEMLVELDTSFFQDFC